MSQEFQALSRRVQRLPLALSERIAAGEVIERPASVVKELVENALDAGAQQVLVRLEAGGKELIEVIDDGHGMLPEDLQLCVERHATSKLSCLEDLERILTLGFRGEALPSIAAVAELTLVSRSREAPLEPLSPAYRLQVGDSWAHPDLSKKPSLEPLSFGSFVSHRPHGTWVQVRNLFHQIPARLKFLKSQAAEVSQTRDYLERLALCYPEVAFQLESDGRSLLHLPGRPQSLAPVAHFRERLKLIWGEEGNQASCFFHTFTTPDNPGDLLDRGLRMQVDWWQGFSSKTTQKMIQVVNGRPLKDRLLQQAILSAFRQSLLPGQFPALVFQMTLEPTALDVNVHPAKTEVRFLEPQKIFQKVETFLKKCLHQTQSASFPQSLIFPLQEKPWQEGPLEPPLSVATSVSLSDPRVISWGPGKEHSVFEAPLSLVERDYTKTRDSRPSMPPLPSLSFSPSSSAPSSASLPEEFQAALYRGTVFQTYWIYEQKGELVVFDQHAVHERIQYEALKKRIFSPTGSSALASAQKLLFPETLPLPKDQEIPATTFLLVLEKLGFEAELFGEHQCLVRAVPAVWGTAALSVRLRSLIDRIQASGEAFSQVLGQDFLWDEGLFEKVASEACHSSVRAHEALSIAQIQALLQALFRTDHPWNCPHGRPTLIRLTESKWQEFFLRRKI